MRGALVLLNQVSCISNICSAGVKVQRFDISMLLLSFRFKTAYFEKCLDYKMFKIASSFISNICSAGVKVQHYDISMSHFIVFFLIIAHFEKCPDDKMFMIESISSFITFSGTFIRSRTLREYVYYFVQLHPYFE